MFRLHISNDAAKLADALGEQLRAARGNPLLPAQVLVPQAGLRRWLQVHLGERLGVLANVEFVPPAQFTWELLRAARPDLPERSPFDVEVLRWHLYALLGERRDGAALAPLREYLAGDGDPLRRYALALELARAYERLQGYRRERLLAWERGGGAGDWQAELWRRLLPRVGGASRAARVDDWLRRFDPGYPPGCVDAKPAPPGLPESFACFACSNVSPDVLRMLAVAGRHCDVDFYLPLPSREYLGDTPRYRREVRARLAEKDDGNPLVTSLGGAAAEFVELLYGYEHVQPDAEIDLFDEDITRGTLLGRVRDDLLRHAVPRADDRTAQPDGSLQFHACHTPLREVQTLHDELLALFDDKRFDPPLQPRDVAVMLPDIAGYAPAIEAVFGGIGRDDPRWLPFNLGDAGATALHPVAQLFLDLLDAPASRWEASELLGVLSVPGVMRRFDLDADAVARLAGSLRDAGVRWGEDERARAGCGDYREFSWAFGIERLLAGFACGDAGASGLCGNTAPAAGIEGEAFGHLDAVLAVLATWRRLRDESPEARTATAWQTFLNETLDGLYQHDSRDTAETRALDRIRAALQALALACRAAAPEPELHWPEVRAFLRDALAAADPHQYLFTGGITFCGMVPLRVVPFRVICLLGMDEAAFPRREGNGLDPLLADRRAGHAEKGDRDVRADDRLLFLQLLAAARDVFYVSWIGRDAHSNETLAASVVVTELMDVLREHYLPAPADDEAKQRRDAYLPQVEPLHPFDARLFDARAPRSFRDAWLPSARAPRRSTAGPAPFVAASLPARGPAPPLRLADLQRFFANPARGFLEEAVGLRLPRDADSEADLEPLAPAEGLLRWQLTSALLAGGEADLERTRALLRAQAALPPGELADAALATARERAAALREAIVDFTSGAAPCDDIAGSVRLADGTTLEGRVGGVYPAGLVRVSAGRLNGKRALAAWVDALFATVATGEPMGCRLVHFDKKACHCDLAYVNAEDARGLLAQFVAAWQSGLREPLPLFPKAAWDALKRTHKSGEAGFGEFIARLAGKLEKDNTHGDAGELQEAAVRMAWRGRDPTTPPLAETTYATARLLLPGLRAEAKR